MTDHSGSTGRRAAESDAPTGQLRAPSGLSIEVAGLTDKGRVRPGNEDSLTFEDPHSAQARAQGTLLVVSDGMGGHAAGEVASKIAVETIHAAYYRNRGMPPDAAIHDAITRANAAIYEAAQQNRERAGMGCTVVALVVQGADLTIGHVGDSRAYLIRGGRATQLTLDHSWVAMQVHEGILTPEQAEHHPNRSVLMRALGRQASVEIDIGHRQLQPGDILLVCSDGLTGMVTDAEIAEYAGRVPPQALPSALVELANQRGAPDNVTVLISAIGGPLSAAQAATQTRAVDPNNTTTVIAAPQDARTPRLDAPESDTPTDRNLRRPAVDATMPMGVPGAATAATAGGTAAVAAPAASPAAGASAAPPHGRPVVVSRSSVADADAPAGRRRGRGRWIAGALAAFGLAGALVLISIFQLTRDGAPTQTVASVTSTPVPAAAPAAPAAPPAPAATVPPPISSQLPGLATPSGTGPQAAAPAARPTSPPSPTTVGSPAAATATPNPVLTAVPTLAPTLRSIFATAIPTLSGGPRTSEAPATSSDGLAPAPAPSSTGAGSSSGAGGAGAGGGGPSGGAATTTEPSSDGAPPAETAPESAPEPEPSGAAPVPSTDGARGSSSDLCARGSVLAPELAARAGCKPSNSNDSGR